MSKIFGGPVDMSYFSMGKVRKILETAESQTRENLAKALKVMVNKFDGVARGVLRMPEGWDDSMGDLIMKDPDQVITIACSGKTASVLEGTDSASV